jgi:uncharacterized protein YbbC (DUF1343 family)
MACASVPHTGRGRPPVRPGITVLLEDSIGLVRGKRTALLTNQSGIDEHGVSDIDLLATSARAREAGVQLVALCSPEHGIRGTEDRSTVTSGTDSATGLPIYSLYHAATVLPPPDSLLDNIDVLVIDLQDVGTRTWTYVGSVIYALQAAARLHRTVVVLDRPNPITGTRVEGPILDPGLANLARPYALYPMPLRHGMTMGELAKFYNDTLGIGADLHVVPVDGWRRRDWFDRTGLKWVRPSPNLPSATSVLLYPAVVAFEGSNLSVGRGTPIAFQMVGAPWLDAVGTVSLLNGRGMRGVRFEADTITPTAPTDGKYRGRSIPVVRIVVTDRDRVRVGRVAAAVLWALARTGADSMRVDTTVFDLRFGDGGLRRALMAGQDPDEVIDQTRAGVVDFERRARRYWIYH